MKHERRAVPRLTEVTRETRQAKAVALGAGSYAVTAGILLHPMSPQRFTILGQIWVAAVLAVVSALPILAALLIGDFVPGWIGRVSLVAGGVVTGWMLLLALFLWVPGPLETLIGHETWDSYLGELQFAGQYLAVLGGELVLLIVTTTRWPWLRRGETVLRDPS